MEITEAMKKQGWKLINGTWVAPVEESSKKVSRILITESTLGPGWVKVPVHQAGQIKGFKRLGLSDAEAVLAAGGKAEILPDNSPFGILRKTLTRVRKSNADFTD